jgi:site-specific recombinase XerC
MIQLKNGCYCSTPKVNPTHWFKANTRIVKDWFIYYRFYDPLYKTNPKYKKGKLVILKGMNHLKTYSLRFERTKELLAAETRKLCELDYNPIKRFNTTKEDLVLLIEPDTSFIKALKEVEKEIKGASSTKRDLKSVIRYVEKVAIKLGLNELPIATIGRKHIKLTLSQIERTYGYSPHRYNKIRSYLMILFNRLLEVEAVDTNPVHNIIKQKTIQKLRRVIPIESRPKINDFLIQKHYRFWIFTQIFFHSGARLTEMMLIKRKDVNLEGQYFIVTINKGKIAKEVQKTIKNLALPYWQKAIESAEINDYIFSKGLLPGKISISSTQITRRWNTHIKKKLQVEEDFYSLKHLNLDQMATLLNLNDASAMASHTSTYVTLQHYAIGERQRQIERLKNANNKFG